MALHRSLLTWVQMTVPQFITGILVKTNFSDFHTAFKIPTKTKQKVWSCPIAINGSSLPSWSQNQNPSMSKRTITVFCNLIFQIMSWGERELTCPKQKHTSYVTGVYTYWAGRAGLDLTFVSYLVLQTSASLITNCTLVVIISNRMILFYMWRSQNQKNMEQWKYFINALSGCSIQLLYDS